MKSRFPAHKERGQKQEVDRAKRPRNWKEFVALAYYAGHIFKWLVDLIRDWMWPDIEPPFVYITGSIQTEFGRSDAGLY